MINKRVVSITLMIQDYDDSNPYSIVYYESAEGQMHVQVNQPENAYPNSVAAIVPSLFNAALERLEAKEEAAMFDKEAERHDEANADVPEEA